MSATICVGLVAGVSSLSWAATITVNSLADDVFSDSVCVGSYRDEMHAAHGDCGV